MRNSELDLTCRVYPRQHLNSRNPRTSLGSPFLATALVVVLVRRAHHQEMSSSEHFYVWGTLEDERHAALLASGLGFCFRGKGLKRHKSNDSGGFYMDTACY